MKIYALHALHPHTIKMSVWDYFTVSISRGFRTADQQFTAYCCAEGYRTAERVRYIFDVALGPYRLVRTRWYHCLFSKKEHTMMYLYFVTPADVDGKESEPLLASAGRDPEDSWKTLAANRQRMSGNPLEDVAALKREFTASGHVVHKFSATPV